MGSPQLCAPMSPSARPCAGTQTTKQLCAIMLDTQSAMSRIASWLLGLIMRKGIEDEAAVGIFRVACGRRPWSQQCNVPVKPYFARILPRWVKARSRERRASGPVKTCGAKSRFPEFADDKQFCVALSAPSVAIYCRLKHASKTKSTWRDTASC
jgi:hypothetical protein